MEDDIAAQKARSHEVAVRLAQVLNDAEVAGLPLVAQVELIGVRVRQMDGRWEATH